jgi:hypothetical protein
VSNKAARTLISEERLKVMMEFTSIAGVTLDGSKAIQVCSGVEFEDTTPKEEPKPKIEVKQVESALPKNEPKGKDAKK